jgi:DNA-binding CsgD family transcriptional regulator
MAATRETFDRITRGRQAIMAIDHSERVTAWNKPAERLFGLAARSVLGKRCYEVLGGRDAYGNLYCHRACPIAHQARFSPAEPVHRFPLDVRAGQGGTKRVMVSTFAVAASRPSLATVVHVLRKPDRDVSEPAFSSGNELAPPILPQAHAVAEELLASRVTEREREILRCLAEGLQSEAIGKRLHITKVTVRNHVQTILRRLDVHTRLAAVKFARDHNLV